MDRDQITRGSDHIVFSPYVDVLSVINSKQIEVKFSYAITICIILVFHYPTSVLFDSKSTFPYVSIYFSLGIAMMYESFFRPIMVTTPQVILQ